MHRKKSRVVLSGLFFLVMLSSPKDALSAFIEGVDTTDINGYGLDSAFKVDSHSIIAGQNIALYGSKLLGVGFFNYSFEDVKMAPAAGYVSLPRGIDSTFNLCVIKKKDSTYAKAQILKKLVDGRHVFKFASNTMPNDRLLEKSDYDRSVRYKPNNAFNHYHYGGIDSLSWEPPLPNNNHLLGYILYQTKQGAVIDTMIPINTAQWDSIAFAVSTILANPAMLKEKRYLNLVAVYTEGKSDFLDGWTYFAPTAVGIKSFSPIKNKLQNNIEIKKSLTGLIFNFPPSPVNTTGFSIGIFDISSRRVATFSNPASGQIFWRPANQLVSGGLYILRAEASDGSAVNQPFVVPR